MGTEVKYFHSAMFAAPALSGSVGAMLSLLDACLADGFDNKSMVGTGTIVSGVATLPFSGSHSSEVGTVITVAGATPSSLNGEKRVTAKAASSVSFETVEADGSITGTVTFKMSPLGFTKPFTGTNKRAYKPSDVLATGMSLRVDDSATTSSRVVGYETMSDIDTGTGPFPTATQSSGGGYWPKSSTADATARPWTLIGDSRGFYLYLSPNASFSSQGVVYGFGDFTPYKSGDAYACFLACSAGSIIASAAVVPDCLGYAQPASTGGLFMVPRAYTALGSALQMFQTSAHATANGYSGTATYNARSYQYPNGPDNGLMLSEVEVGHAQSGGVALRGKVPGVYHTPQLAAASFGTRDTIAGASAYAGKTLMNLRTGMPAGATYGCLWVDVTGPWR
jgi:hypothetical protein